MTARIVAALRPLINDCLDTVAWMTGRLADGPPDAPSRWSERPRNKCEENDKKNPAEAGSIIACGFG
jgi:hypothetical protein